MHRRPVDTLLVYNILILRLCFWLNHCAWKAGQSDCCSLPWNHILNIHNTIPPLSSKPIPIPRRISRNHPYPQQGNLPPQLHHRPNPNHPKRWRLFHYRQIRILIARPHKPTSRNHIRNCKQYLYKQLRRPRVKDMNKNCEEERCARGEGRVVEE